jgi:hypothetical protein
MCVAEKGRCAADSQPSCATALTVLQATAKGKGLVHARAAAAC